MTITEKKARWAARMAKSKPEMNGREIYDAMKKKFGGGMDYQAFYQAIRTARGEQPAKLKKAPKQVEVEVSPALPADVAELIKAEMKKAKDSGAVFIVDLAKLEEDIKRLNQMAEVMRPHGYAKMVVTADGFEIDQMARKIQGKL